MRDNSPAPSQDSRDDRTILLLASASFFSGSALRICDSLLPRLARDFSVTAGVAGRVIIAFAIAYGLMQLMFGPIGDRFGKAKVVCAALFGCSAGALASAFAPDFDALVGLRALWGMAAAGVIPLAMAWIGDTVPYERRQATLARLLTGTLSGMMFGQLAGGLFADSAWGWRGAFFVLGVGYGIVGVLLFVRMRGVGVSTNADAPTKLRFIAQLRAVLEVRWARVVLLACLAESLLLGPLAYMPAYLHQRFELTLASASALIALFAVGGLAYSMTARHIVRRFGERWMVLAGGLLIGVGYFAWWLSPWWPLAGPIALFVGFGTYLYHNTLQTHATQMVPAVRGTAVALFALSLFVGQAIGVALAGYAFDHWGPAPLLLTPALTLPIAGWAFARALRRRAAEQI
jgi:predicted MFS family arabinose efflux permease